MAPTVTVEQEVLARALAIVSRAVPPRFAWPVLGHILIETQADHLLLTGTDLTMHLVVRLSAMAEANKRLAVPAHLLLSLVKSLPKGKINLELTDRELRLCSGRNEAKIRGQDANEFPRCSILEQEQCASTLQLVISQPDALGQAIQQVLFAASTNESRPILTGILFRLEGDMLTLVAADGFRLSVSRVQLSETEQKECEVVIPAATMRELKRLLTERQTSVSLFVNAEVPQICWHLAGALDEDMPAYNSITSVDLVSSLLVGKYVNYQALIPKSYVTRVVLDTHAFLHACRICALFAKSDMSLVMLELMPDSGIVRLTAQSAELGQNTVNIEAQVTGEPLSVGFNVQYLLDALNAVGTEQVAMELINKVSPGVFRPVSLEKDKEFVHILMPMDVRE